MGYTGIILGHKMNSHKTAFSILYGFISYMFVKYRCFVKKHLIVILISILLLGSGTVLLGSKLLERQSPILAKLKSPIL